MRLKSVSFRNVGPFGVEGVRLDGFTPGLNVVCKTNEFGKSSILEALQFVLFRPFASTKSDIKKLVHSGSMEGFEGEICFSVGDRNYRFWKSFIKKKGARLQDLDTGENIAVDRTAEETLAKLLKAEFTEKGPSGLLWVKQGASMDGVKDDGQIASRLEGELGTLIGGERAREYLTRVEVELAEGLTKTGQEKKGGPLKNAREAVEATQTELSEATRLRDLTTSIGLEFTRVKGEIERLSGQAEDENLAAKIETKRAEMTAARSFENSLALLAAQHNEATTKAERAADRRDDHVTKMVSFNEATAELTAAKAAYQAETATLKETETRRAELRGSVTEIEARLEEMSRVRARRETLARQTQRLETLQKDRVQLRARLDQLKTLEDDQTKLTDRISDLPVVTRADVETLRRAANEVRQCETELAAFSTHLFLDLSAEGRGKVTLDGAALPSGPIELPGGAALSLDGIGTLRSDDSRLRETTRNRDRARQDYANFLENFSVQDTEEASKFADQRQALEEERKAVTRNMANLAPEGRAAIEADFAARDMEARELAETVQEAQEELGEADDTAVLESLRNERAKLEVMDAALSTARQSLSNSETEQARLRERLTGLGLPEDEAARRAQADLLAGEKLKADADVRAIAVQVDALKAKAPAQSVELLTASLERLEEVASSSHQRLANLKTDAATLQARRDAAFEGGDADAIVAGLTARLKTEQDTLARHVREKDVRVLLRDTLVETQTRLRDAYTAPVSEELAPLLSHVIPGAQAGLGDSLGVDTVTRYGKQEAIDQLSGGTQEQFAILTRLAYARLLARSGAGAPVILDDALVYADDARRDAMFDVLRMVSAGDMPIQILYLSCHADATRHLGGNTISPQPWPKKSSL